MVSGAPIAFPPLPGRADVPRWTGDDFLIGHERARVLAYGAGPSGWTDHLTDLHEGTAGADHFIDLASRRHAIAEAARVHGPTPHVILEVGVSSGYLIEDLTRVLPHAVILGSDYTRGTLEKAATRLPHVPLLQFDLVDCPLPDASVDTVILLNVLEHIERDDLALAQVYRILRSNGAVIVEVPAGEGLFDSYDRALMHWRRYRMSGLVRLLHNAGFAVERRSHLACALYPAFWLAKQLRRAAPAPDEALEANLSRSIRWTARIGAVARALLATEARARRHVYLPFGIRCLATGRKRAEATG
jgi:SAM-dependent methyltransferase